MKNKVTYKTPLESETVTTEVVCPNDANPMGLLQGGRLVEWMDTTAAVTAQTHAGRIAVTASIDSLIFKRPARIGDIISIKAKITRAFDTSMEIFVGVWTRKVISKEEYMTNEAYFTFVALDDNAQPTKTPQVKPVTKEEKAAYAAALRRREGRKRGAK